LLSGSTAGTFGITGGTPGTPGFIPSLVSQAGGTAAGVGLAGLLS